MLTEKVNSRQSQAALTQTALHHLKNLGTEYIGGVGKVGERERERERERGREEKRVFTLINLGLL